MKHGTLALGALVLVLAWSAPLLPQLAPLPFARHMLVHVAVLAVAAPLIGSWLAGARRARLPSLAPLPAAAFGLGIVWLWHVPLLHGLAGLSLLGWALQHLSFLGAGLLVWTSAVRPARPASADAVLALLVTSAHLALLGTLLTLAPPLYGHGIHTLGDAYAELVGQRLGGLLMLAGALPYLACGLWLVERRLRGPLVRPLRVRAGEPGDPAAAGIDIARRIAARESIHGKDSSMTTAPRGTPLLLACAAAVLVPLSVPGDADAASCREELDRLERELNASGLAAAAPDTHAELLRALEEAAELRDEAACMERAAELEAEIAAAAPDDDEAASPPAAPLLLDVTLPD